MAPRQPPKKGGKSAAPSKRTPAKPKVTAKRKAAPKSKAKTKSASKAKPKAASKAKPKAASKAKPKASRPRGTPAVTSPVRRPAPRRRWWVVALIEVGTVAAAVALGLGIAGYSLWRRAERDVEAWLANPPRSEPSLVLSAPMRLEVGQPLLLDELAEDLAAAGYERVDAVNEPGQARIADGTVHAWTGPWAGPGTVTEGRVKVQVVDGRIASTAPNVVVLRPTVLARLGDLEADRTPIALDAVSRWVEPTVLAMEDARFREHGGIDPIGVVRAVVHNLTTGGRMHGGSTLTQQLAKNLFLTQDRTARRKVREAFFASALEARLDKDTLLEMYLGEVYLGQVGGVPVHGVEQAARAWFAVSAERLTLGQAATIAGVISSPNTYSPIRHPDRAAERRDLVLDRVAALGWATPDEIRSARAQPIAVSGVVTGPPRRAPWAVDAALDTAEDALGPDGLTTAGYVVHTTIQPHLQRAAERAVRDGLAEVVAAHGQAADAQAALVAVRADDGAVVALVGSRDYRESPFDRATSAWRQAGSTVKPLALLAAFDANPSLNATSVVVDEPISRRIDGKAWSPKNYDGKYLGAITLRTALEQSRNVPAVKIAEEVGARALQAALRDTGLSRATNLPSAALGAFETTPLELAGAYTIFPGGGEPSGPRIVESITERGQIVVAFAPTAEPIASARAAAQITTLLEGVVTDGTGRGAARYGVRGAVGAKTGTTDDGRDAWVAGVTPGYAVVAWVGRDRGAPLGLGGSTAAMPIWGRFVADGGVRGGRFEVPEGMVTVAVCRDSGKPARDVCPITVDDLFVDGHVPNGKCDEHGGPVVDAGRWLKGIFGGGKPKAAVEGDAEAEAEAPEATDGRRRRRR